MGRLLLVSAEHLPGGDSIATAVISSDRSGRCLAGAIGLAGGTLMASGTLVALILAEAAIMALAEVSLVSLLARLALLRVLGLVSGNLFENSASQNPCPRLAGCGRPAVRGRPAARGVSGHFVADHDLVGRPFVRGDRREPSVLSATGPRPFAPGLSRSGNLALPVLGRFLRSCLFCPLTAENQAYVFAVFCHGSVFGSSFGPRTRAEERGLCRYRPDRWHSFERCCAFGLYGARRSAILQVDAPGAYPAFAFRTHFADFAD